MKENIKLKTNAFLAIQVTGDPGQFSELKDFAGDQISITYERATGIGDYWCITLEDDLKDRTVVIPDGSYILMTSGGFLTVISQEDYRRYFELQKSEAPRDVDSDLA